MSSVASGSKTKGWQFSCGIAAILLCVLSSGCADKTPPLQTTLTFRDGSHFSGTVVRRETNSITVTGAAGDTHTFLYTELTDIQDGAPETPAATTTGTGQSDTSTSAKTGSPGGAANGKVAVSGTGTLQFPAGAEFPVRTSGFLDSCCVPPNAVSLGVIDGDVKDSSGKVVIPAGANVTITLLEDRKTDGRLSMIFELGSADFNGHHYVISSTKGGTEPGIRVTFTGAKEGSPEATARGTNIHLEDQSFMGFKAETPVIFKISQ